MHYRIAILIDTNFFYKSVKINKGIHSEKGIKKIIEREYLGCFSFLEFDDNVGKMYGMEKLTKTKQEIECVTVNEVLAENNLTHIDFLKIDLEGLDFEIIKNDSVNNPIGTNRKSKWK